MLDLFEEFGMVWCDLVAKIGEQLESASMLVIHIGDVAGVFRFDDLRRGGTIERP